MVRVTVRVPLMSPFRVRVSVRVRDRSPNEPQ